MGTELQRRFVRSKVFRRYCDVIVDAAGAPYKGYKRLWRRILRESAQWTEPEIKRILYLLLLCCDVSTIERQEALDLLRSAETTLTAGQRKRLKQQLDKYGWP